MYRFVFRNKFIMKIQDIPLERNWVREDPSLGGNDEKWIAHRIHKVTAYAWVLSDTFSLQWDMLAK